MIRRLIAALSVAAFLATAVPVLAQGEKKKGPPAGPGNPDFAAALVKLIAEHSCKGALAVAEAMGVKVKIACKDDGGKEKEDGEKKEEEDQEKKDPGDNTKG